MDYSVARSIQNIGGRLYSSARPFQTSTPSLDYINPGLNIQLYQEIVPITSGSVIHSIEQKHENVEATPKEDHKLHDQTGAGLDNQELIEHSFLHPRPIKTETIQLFKQNKSSKRKETTNLKSVPKKKKIAAHKFQFV